MMDWQRLLNPRRIGADPARTPGEGRTEFERDYHRILFSYPFRRLQGKTQVFPLPANDHIHNRLTHSLEVSAVGRSMGKLVGGALLKKYPALAQGHDASDIGDIIAAACLAHDLGNPPFGHAGEDAIGRWFRDRKDQDLLGELTQRQLADLSAFEGNAQGFRIAARLSMYTGQGGMRLTAPVLGAFAKYPQASVHARCSAHVARKKYNFFAAEEGAFRSLAEELGLTPWAEPDAWQRHPLAYLVEAADDICYSIMDAEDGYLTERFSYAEVCDLLEPLAGLRAADCTGNHDERVNRLRAKAIGGLVEQCVQAFLEQESALLAGTVERPLLDSLPAANQLAIIAKQSDLRCYRDHEVVQILLAGFRVIGELLSIFIPVVLGRESGRYARDVMLFLPDEVSQAEGAYARVMAVTDFISGMTDDYAITVFRRLTGMELPGARTVAAKR